MPYSLTQQDLDNIAQKGATLKIGGTSIYAPRTINNFDQVRIEINYGQKLKFENQSCYFERQDPNTGEPIYKYFTVSQQGARVQTNMDANNYYALVVNTVSSLVNIPFVYSEDRKNVIESNNCILQINGVDAQVNDIANEGDTLKLVVNSGFIIAETSLPNLANRDINGYFGEAIPFIVAEDRKTASLVLPPLEEGSSWEHVRNLLTEQFTEVAGTNNVYLIDSTKLKQVNEVRFQGTQESGVYDYGNYILSVLQLPFDIPESLILLPDNIRLGDFDTEVEADVISTDRIRVDMGTISVPNENGNLLDFANTATILHLPLANSISIDPQYVIGEEIGIEYIIDVYTGNATINITSTKTNETIETIQADIGVSVPYVRDAGSAILSNSNIKVGGQNNISTPFIEVIRNAAYLPDGTFTIPIVDEGTLTELGYYEVDKIKLVVNATSEEKQEIINILSQGVFIND